MILYAKSIGATGTVLGLIASLTPILTIAQIPAARFLARPDFPGQPAAVAAAAMICAARGMRICKAFT